MGDGADWREKLAVEYMYVGRGLRINSVYSSSSTL